MTAHAGPDKPREVAWTGRLTCRPWSPTLAPPPLTGKPGLWTGPWLDGSGKQAGFDVEAGVACGQCRAARGRAACGGSESRQLVA